MRRERADPFGSEWQIHPDVFARQVAEGEVFGSRSRVTEGGSKGLTGTAVDADAVSATLGWLYLEQGHLEDAEEIFRLVLDRQPGDARARDGQREVARRRRAARRVARLNRFLDRVRDPGD